MICPNCSRWIAPPAKICSHCQWTTPVARGASPSSTPISPPVPVAPIPPSSSQATHVPPVPPTPSSSSQAMPSSNSSFPSSAPYPYTPQNKRTVATPLAWALVGLLGTGLCVCVALLLTSSKPPVPQSAASVVSQSNMPVVQQQSAPSIPTGPSFTEVDSKMDDRLYKWTEAQKEAYWKTVVGTQITWSGEMVEASTQNNGDISLRCNPETYGSDVFATLDGTQLEKLPSLNRGVHVTITGIMEGHGMSGYTISQAHIVGL